MFYVCLVHVKMVPEELQRHPRRALRVDRRNTILTDGGPKGSQGWPRDPKREPEVKNMKFLK